MTTPSLVLKIPASAGSSPMVKQEHEERGLFYTVKPLPLDAATIGAMVRALQHDEPWALNALNSITAQKEFLFSE